LIVVVLSVSVIAGGIVLLVPDKTRLLITCLAVLVIFLVNFPYCHPWGTFSPDLSLVRSNPDKFLSELVPQDGGDYIPIWVKNGVKGLPHFMPLQKMQELTEGGQVLDSKQINPLRYTFKVRSRQGSIFCFHSFYFPGWTVTIDGSKADILTDNPWGLIIFRCPDGVHDAEVYFGTTPLRQTAKGITIVSMILLVLALLFLK
jgi:hypothetical protein